MDLYFITSNEKKFSEAQMVLPFLKRVDLDLDEIQELDTKKIIQHKVKQAKTLFDKDFVAEDISLCINAWNGLPGPFVKWFVKSTGAEGLYKLIEDQEDKSAYALCELAYVHGDEVKFFEGRINGYITKPKIDNGFGWDPLFVPEGSDLSYAEMDPKEGYKLKNRYLAFSQLKDYLQSRNRL